MKSYLVIGLGRFGTRVATQLYAYGEDVLAVDASEALVNAIADRVTRAVTADATDRDTLIRLGAKNFDAAIVAIGGDLAASVLITMHLKALGVPKILCKAHDDPHREILEKLGADEVIIPERAVADKVARTLAAPNILEYIELSDAYSIVECTAPRVLTGKPIRDLNVRVRFGVNILAIRQGDSVRVSPSAEDVIPEGATLVLLGENDALEKFKNAR